ncbi:MAG: DUF4159 domain-containing protein [Armatimonadota bacterium]|nr:DUF4159 domain-containing protein [Armatimonadota bacterium]
MSRCSKTQPWLLLLAALAAVALAVLPARPGLAATYTYDARQRVVNAGVLFVGSESDPISNTSGASNPAPYIFHVLDLRPDVKPVGWTFVNPLAPTQVSPAMVNRWGVYNVNQPLNATMAAYWEVPLHDTSAEQLQQFDVLYLHASYKVGTVSYAAQFTPADNEKLRRFVDGGGQLFVEYGGAATENSTTSLNALFADVQWTQNPGLSNSGLPFVGSLSFLHPIASEPYLLTATDFAGLGMANDAPNNTIYGSLTPSLIGDYNALFGSVLDRYSSPSPGTDNGSPAVVAGQLGAGQVVASALEIGRQVSLSFGANFLSTNLAGAPTADLKLLSNAISWIDTHPT